MLKSNKTKLLALLFSFLLVACQPQEETQVDENNFEALTSSIKLPVHEQKDLPDLYQIGHSVSAEIIAGWDIDIRPDGLGLPAGSGTVETGESLYDEKCASCHGSFGEGEDQWPKLSGGENTLTHSRPTKTVGSYWPYASTLWDYIHRAMPFTAPQSLEDNEVYALTAYVLYLNDIVDEDFNLTRENFASIEMPNQNNFYLDDRPDTHNTRCMENCRDKSTLTEILGPKYSLVTDTRAQNTKIQKASLSTDTDIIKIYNQACKICHSTGTAGAPTLANSKDWLERLERGKETIYQNALNGINQMPAKGGRRDLSDEKIKAIVNYMLASVNFNKTN